MTTTPPAMPVPDRVDRLLECITLGYGPDEYGLYIWEYELLANGWLTDLQDLYTQHIDELTVEQRSAIILVLASH